MHCQAVRAGTLQVVSIQMASSGVLLMLSADYSGSIYGIRSRFQACIPGVHSAAKKGCTGISLVADPALPTAASCCSLLTEGD